MHAFALPLLVPDPLPLSSVRSLTHSFTAADWRSPASSRPALEPQKPAVAAAAVAAAAAAAAVATDQRSAL